MNKNNAKFGVYCGIPKATDIKIHNSRCIFYLRHDPDAPTTNWHYFDNLKEATQKAKEIAKELGLSYRDCKFCKPNN